ncbi:MAG: hypothetical protein ACRDTE_06980 [Pseudonocardiaceae bacterium]
MTWQAWLVVAVIVLVALWRYGWHRRRYPDKGCPRCDGSPWSPRPRRHPSKGGRIDTAPGAASLTE